MGLLVLILAPLSIGLSVALSSVRIRSLGAQQELAAPCRPFPRLVVLEVKSRAPLLLFNRGRSLRRDLQMEFSLLALTVC